MKKFRFMVKMKDQLGGYFTPWAPMEGGTLKDIGSVMEDELDDGYSTWFGFVDVDGYRIVRRDDIGFIFLQESDDDDD